MNEIVGKTFDEVAFDDADSFSYTPVKAKHAARETFPKHVSASDLKKVKRSRRIRAFFESDVPFLASSLIALVAMLLAMVAGITLIIVGF